MVKLVFNPKDTNSVVVGISKTSKKVSKQGNLETFVKSLNPFNSDHFEEISVKINLPEITTKDIVGLENCHYVLNKWYNDSLLDLNSKLLLIIGPTGCGKTLLVETYCHEENISLYTVKFNTVKTKKEMLKDIFNFIEYNSCSFFSKSENQERKLILIDEYQNGQNDLLSISDINNFIALRSTKVKSKELHTFVSGVVNINNIPKIPPILIIGNNSKGTKLSDLKKSSEVYYINELNLKPWMTKIIKIKKIIISDLDLNLMMSKCKSDKRLFLNITDFLKNNDKGSLTNFINSFYKDEDINHFDFTNKLFDNIEPITLNEIFNVYETDGFLISNLVHENYIDFNKDIDFLAISADCISYGETIYSDTYESTKSFSPGSHCTQSLYFPSFYSRSDVKNNKCQLRSSVINNRYNIYLNNKKIIDKINNGEQNILTVEDIFFIKKFINSTLVKSKIFTEHQTDYLTSILNTFKFNKLEKLELIYKHFSDFKDNTKEPKIKNFTIKFKEKLNKIISLNEFGNLSLNE